GPQNFRQLFDRSGRYRHRVPAVEVQFSTRNLLCHHPPLIEKTEQDIAKNVRPNVSREGALQSSSSPPLPGCCRELSAASRERMPSRAQLWPLPRDTRTAAPLSAAVHPP